MVLSVLGVFSCSIDGSTVSFTLVGHNETVTGQSSRAKGHNIRAEVMKYKGKCTYRFAKSTLQENTRVKEGFVVMQESIPVHKEILCFLEQ